MNFSRPSKLHGSSLKHPSLTLVRCDSDWWNLGVSECITRRDSIFSHMPKKSQAQHLHAGGSFALPRLWVFGGFASQMLEVAKCSSFISLRAGNYFLSCQNLNKFLLLCHTSHLSYRVHFEHVSLMKVPVIKKNYVYRSAIKKYW